MQHTVCEFVQTILTLAVAIKPVLSVKVLQLENNETKSSAFGGLKGQ